MGGAVIASKDLRGLLMLYRKDFGGVPRADRGPDRKPYAVTHATLPEVEKRAAGIEPGGIRLSVGLEDWNDIIDDLNCALDHVSQ